WHNGNCPSGPPPAGFPPRSAARIAAQRGQTGGAGDGGRGVRPPLPPPPPHYYCSDTKGPDCDFSAGVMLVDAQGKGLVVAGRGSEVGRGVGVRSGSKRRADLEVGY